MQIATTTSAPTWGARTQTSGASNSGTGVGSTPESRRAAFDRVSLPTLARAIGAALGDLHATIQNGSRLSLPVGAPSPALTGVPMTGIGIPDFEKIREAGGQVNGALPPLPPGSESFTMISESGTTSYFAAEINLNDGKGPRYVKGATYTPNPSATPELRHRAVAEISHYFARLPEDMDVARRNGMANIFDFGAEGSSIDTRA